HIGAAGGERARDRPSDVARAARDQHDLSSQIRPARRQRGSRHRRSVNVRARWRKYRRSRARSANIPLWRRGIRVAQYRLESGDPHAPARKVRMATISDRIRARLNAAGERFRANDNIAEFIEPGELEALTDEVAARVKDLLQSLVIDTENDHNTRETGAR